jgi:hypothetical protein
VCFRRLLLAGFVVFIFPDSAAQAAVASIFAACCLLVAVHFKPHADVADSGIYFIGGTIIFFSMFLSLMTKVNITQDESQSQDVFAVLLIILNVGMVLAAVAQVAIVGHSTYASKTNTTSTSVSQVSANGNVIEGSTVVAPYGKRFVREINSLSTLVKIVLAD